MLEDQAPGFGEGERVQIVDQVAEAPGLVQERGEVAVVAGMDAVELGLDLALQDGQWVAQLVGDVGEEAPPLLFAGGKPRCHLVEGGGEERAAPGVLAPATSTPL